MLRYLFCVVPTAASPDLSGWRGEGSPLELVVHDGFAGVVGRVSAERYGARALAKASASVDALAPYAKTHESVVQYVFERTSAVVPLRFGSVHRRATDVAKVLAEDAAQLRALLERFEGMQEWGLRVARIRRARASRAASGTAYLRSRRAELRGELDAGARTAIERLERSLSSHAKARRVLDEARGDLLLRVAYLVPAGRGVRVKRAVVAAGKDLGERNVAVELSGPWPPYSFVGT